jgi:uroporphyrinogen-III synthase
MPEMSMEKSIAITRPVGQGEETSRFVRKLGWIPFIFNTVELRPLEQSTIFEKFSKVIEKGPVDWLVFMSPTGVNAFFDMLESHQSILPSASGQVRIVGVGPRTGTAIKHRGAKDVLVPEKYSSVGISNFLSKFEVSGKRIVLLRSSAADERLALSLASQGALVESITIYQSLIPTETESVQQFLAGLRKGQFQAVLFTSAASVSNMYAMADSETNASQLTRLLRERLVGAIGPVTAERLRTFGVNPNSPERHLIEDAIKELVAGYEELPSGKVRAFS